MIGKKGKVMLWTAIAAILGLVMTTAGVATSQDGCQGELRELFPNRIPNTDFVLNASTISSYGILGSSDNVDIKKNMGKYENSSSGYCYFFIESYPNVEQAKLCYDAVVFGDKIYIDNTEILYWDMDYKEFDSIWRSKCLVFRFRTGNSQLELDSLEALVEECNERITPIKTTTSCFVAVFAIAGLLAIGYLVFKRKR